MSRLDPPRPWVRTCTVCRRRCEWSSVIRQWVHLDLTDTHNAAPSAGRLFDPEVDQ